MFRLVFKEGRLPLRFIAVVVIVGVFCCSVLTHNVSALSGSDESVAINIFTKNLINNVHPCYNYGMVDGLGTSVFRDFNSLLNEGYQQENSPKHPLYIPSIDIDKEYNGKAMNKITATDSKGGRAMDCYALFMGDKVGYTSLDGQMAGLFDIYDIEVPNYVDTSEVNSFMQDKMGYSIDTESSSSSGYCYNVYQLRNSAASTKKSLGSACFDESVFSDTMDAFVISQDIPFEGRDEGIDLDMSAFVVDAMQHNCTTDYYCMHITMKEPAYSGSGNDPRHCIEPNSGGAIRSCVFEIDLDLGKIPTVGDYKIDLADGTGWGEEGEVYSMFVGITKQDIAGSFIKVFKKDDDSWKKAIHGITGKDGTVEITPVEKYEFYKLYLKEYYADSGYDIMGGGTCQDDKPGQLADYDNDTYYVYHREKKQWCVLDVRTEKAIEPHVMTVFLADDNRLSGVITTLGELVNLMGELDIENYSGPDGEDGSLLPSGDDDDSPPDPSCYDNARNLGWILCTILDLMSEAAEDTYNDYVAPALSVDPKLFSDDYGELHEAWGTFQGIANILFVILLIVVIFSQLTGVGIDNYGVKKILPKLIIAAVLVNLSYWICIACVDLSNIVGNGLQSLFDGLHTGASVVDSIGGVGLDDAAEGALVSVGLLAALVGGAAIVVYNPAILVTLLVSALGVMIAVFFLFALLAAREAAIVVLVVISPLAFVCYMLPNTKKLFDKFLKLGEGLLLVYPIAGLLIGGGRYVSRLLLTSGVASEGFFSAFMAMIVGIVPVFFIPTVLRGSFTALGNLGARISGVGQKFSGAVQRGAKGSDYYKQMQERGIERRTRIKAGYDKDGNKKKVGAFGRFMRGGRRNMQRESLRYQKMISDRGSLEATEGEYFMLATETANEMKNIVARGEIDNIGAMEKGLADALKSGDRAKIRAYTDGLTTKGEDGRKAVKAAYDAAVLSGKMSGDAARTFADNVLTNHAADYKGNSRSMFAIAQGINKAATPVAALAAAITTGAYFSTGTNAADLAGKVTATTIGNMDDDEFEELFGGYHGKAVTIPSGAVSNEIGAAAYAALNDQNANIKAERRKYLEDLVKASGYKAKVKDVQVVGGTVDANVTNPVLDVRGTVDVGNEVDVNITQRRGGQVNPVQVGGNIDVREAGMYADPAGNTYRIRKTLDGKYIDDAGFEVDISKFRPR